jgi:hypothetical protein
MVAASCLEKLFEVIGRLPCLVLQITLSNDDVLLIEVTDRHVLVTFVIAGSDHDSLGSSLWPPIVTSRIPLSPLVPLLAALSGAP